MNKIFLTGNLGRDPEIRYTQSGKAVATFSIAVNRWRKSSADAQSQQQTTDFFNVVAWDKRAEFCGKYLTKGTRILIEGRLQTRNYEAQDGTKRYVTEVIADEIEFAGGRRQNYDESQNNLINREPPQPPADYHDEDLDNHVTHDKDNVEIPF